MHFSCFVNKSVTDQKPTFLLSLTQVNGLLTIGENIADNVGLLESFMAYRRYRQPNGPEARLPGLEAFSEEQLFFLSFAHVSLQSSLCSIEHGRFVLCQQNPPSGNISSPVQQHHHSVPPNFFNIYCDIIRLSTAVSPKCLLLSCHPTTALYFSLWEEEER
jgi:hypothetical protein